MKKHQNDSPAHYADSWHTGAHVVAIVHLRANRDANGNPRRVFVGLDKTGRVIATTDEGYAGDPAWVRDACDRGIYAVGFDTEVAEYTRQMSRVERNRGRFALVKEGDEPTPANIFARAWTRDRARKLRKSEYGWAKDLTIVEL